MFCSSTLGSLSFDPDKEDSMQQQRGFTLIEVMIVVVVIAVLAAIAYPSYLQYAVRANRSAAEQLMMEIASKEQQYILDARSYSGTIGTGGLNVSSRDNWTCAATCTNLFYTITVTANNASTPPSFQIAADPVTASAQANDGQLTLDNTGAKSRLVSAVDKGW